MDHFNFDSCDAHRNSIDEENKMSFVTKGISIEININHPKNEQLNEKKCKNMNISFMLIKFS
jgi:hypothetical protein